MSLKTVGLRIFFTKNDVIEGAVVRTVHSSQAVRIPVDSQALMETDVGNLVTYPSVVGGEWDSSADAMREAVDFEQWWREFAPSSVADEAQLKQWAQWAWDAALSRIYRSK